MNDELAVMLSGISGVAAGVGARLLLRSLRRGTQVGPPGCELAVGATWTLLAMAWAAGLVATAWLPVLLALGWFGVCAGLVDLRHHRLPDALTVSALPVALILLVPLGAAAVGRGALGAVVAAGVHAVVHLAVPGSLGAGDVKLAAPLGAVLAAVSWPAVLLAAVLASLLTAGTCLIRARPAVAHGPSMLLATAVVVLCAAGG